MTDLSSAGLHSNAKNFLSFIESGVDPRTGTYSFNVSLSPFFSNALNGPAVPLSLGFDMFSLRDFGFGFNWSLTLSRYDRKARMLYLSNGTSYPATLENGAFSIPDKKVKDIVVSQHAGGDDLIIRHKSGLVEVLGRLRGRPDEWVIGGTFSPEGRQTRFRYDALLRLHEVLDDQHKRVMTVDYSSQLKPLITFWPDSPSDNVVLKLDIDFPPQAVARTVGKITLSGNVDGALTALATWKFKYQDINLFGRYSTPKENVKVISEVQLPGGGVEKITYKPSSFKLDSKKPDNGLPAVVAHEIIPGGAQPNVRREFTYSSNDYRQLHAGFAVKNSAGEYIWINDYDYSSTETLLCDAGRKQTTTRTYNRYHLLTKEITELGSAVLTTDTQYHSRHRLATLNQPPNYQLPRTVTTTFLDRSTGESREEITRTDFDHYGNLLKKVSPSGVIELYAYYPVGGADGCPPDPLTLIRWLKKKTVIPGADGDNAPTISTVYKYKVIKPKETWLYPFHVPSTETIFEGVNTPDAGGALSITGWDYDTGASSKFLGKVASKTETCGGVNTVYEYRYEWDGDVIKTNTKRSCMGVSSASITWQNALTGKLIREDDQQGVTIETRFDGLGRKIAEVVAPDSPYAAQKLYRFKSSEWVGVASEHVYINALGVLKRTFTDGLNRVLAIEVEDSSVQEKPVRMIYKAKYNRSGQLVEELHRDWFDGQSKSLITKYLYDDWGRRIATVGPDGVTVNDQYDPVTMTHIYWKNGGGKTVEKKNAFDKSESIERFDRRGVSFGALRFDYDGLGRCIAKLDREGLQTTFTYDSFGRLIETRLPDDTVIKKEYAKHSTDGLPVRIWANAYMVGEREYDGLLRVTRLTVGGRTERFTYTGAQTKPASHTTASGKTIEYQYEPALNNQVVARKVVSDEKSATQFQYHKIHAALTQATSITEEQSYTYNVLGQLDEASYTRPNVKLRDKCRRSLNGLEWSAETEDGVFKEIEYDSALRVNSVIHGSMKVDYRYDSLGRVNKIVSRESYTKVLVSVFIEYDDFDREVKRRFVFFGGVTEELSQKFNRQDKIIEKELSNEQGVLLEETFEYDPRGRLWGYGCRGPRAPVDSAGKIIRNQTYLYDSLDNIKRVRTTIGTGRETNDAFYFYENEDKTQLTRVAHINPDYADQNARFTYDQDGNQLNDDRGRQLNYDALGRLTSVQGALK